MSIIVSYYPKNIFEKELNTKYKKTISLADLILNINNEENQLSILSQQDLSETEVLTFNMEDASGLAPHVFEKIPKYLNKLSEEYNIPIWINNPHKTLYNLLLHSDLNIVEHPQYEFKTITESTIKTVHQAFDNNIIGQKKAKKIILRSLVKVLTRKNSDKPLVLMFYGKPGIGKTETAKFLAKILFNGEIVREQMSMASLENSINYFKSAKHSEDSFSKKLINRTSNIILLDEFALAHPIVQSSFFQAFDEGIYVDANYSVSLKNSIIICTSNFLSKSQMSQELNSALFSRFDNYVLFEEFSDKEKEELISLTLNKIKNGFDEKYHEKIDWENCLEVLKSRKKSMGNMREIKNYVEDYLTDKLVESIISI